MVLAFATALCFVSGFFVVSAASPKRASRLRLPLRLSLSAGFGLGIFSVVFFVERCFRTKHLLAIDVATTLSLFVLYAWRRKKAIKTWRNCCWPTKQTPMPETTTALRLCTWRRGRAVRTWRNCCATAAATNSLDGGPTMVLGDQPPVRDAQAGDGREDRRQAIAAYTLPDG